MDKLSFIDESCSRCDLHIERTKIVGYRGDKNADIMIVAEAPGQNEDELGIPLIGVSGQMLENELASIGLTSQQCYITNVCKCRPPDNRKPTKTEIKICRDYLFQEILMVRPKYVISLGSTAYYALVNREPPMKDIVGDFTKITINKGEDEYTFNLVVLYHPSFLVRQNGLDIGSPKHTTWKTLIELKERLTNEN